MASTHWYFSTIARLKRIGTYYGGITNAIAHDKKDLWFCKAGNF